MEGRSGRVGQGSDRCIVVASEAVSESVQWGESGARRGTEGVERLFDDLETLITLG